MTFDLPSSYELMCVIRTFEETLLGSFASGLLNGTTHTCIGQEHIAAGVIGALDLERDVVFSNHRCHGHFIAYSRDVDALARELMGREGAIFGGIGGSQHIRYRNFYTNGVQGGIVANATGAALAEKRKRNGALTVAFLGDGTFGEGLVYESLNLAALWLCPILFVVENNRYAQSTPTETTTAGSLEARFAAFGIPAMRTGSQTPTDLRALASDLRARVLSGGPHALIVDTYRLGPHSKSDDTRPTQELNDAWSADPLKTVRALLPEPQAAAIESAAKRRVAEAFERAARAEPSGLEAFAN